MSDAKPARHDDNEFYRKMRHEPPAAAAGGSMREEALALNRARRLARAVEAARADSPGSRLATRDDLRAAASLLVRHPFVPPEGMLPARTKARDALAEELDRLGFPQGFLARDDAEGRLAALAGVVPAPDAAREAWLVGPAGPGSEELLDRAIAAARTDGADRLVAFVPSREGDRGLLLERRGFAREARLDALEARRTAKVRLFMNPRDRVLVLEPGDDPAPALRFHRLVFPGADREEEAIAAAAARPATRLFLLERDGEPAGYLELDLSRRGRAVIPRVGAAPVRDPDGIVRCLLAAAARVVFRSGGLDRLEAHVAERAGVAADDLAPIGYRPAERYARYALALSPPRHE